MTSPHQRRHDLRSGRAGRRALEHPSSRPLQQGREQMMGMGMTGITIRHRITGAALYEATDATSTKEAVESAVADGADLRDADLRGADLRDADLHGADLGRADLRDADLRDADLRDADLRGANLGRANMRGADLRDADLRGADLG